MVIACEYERFDCQNLRPGGCGTTTKRRYWTLQKLDSLVTLSCKLRLAESLVSLKWD